MLCSHINVDFIIQSNGLSLLRKNKHWMHCVPIISMLSHLKAMVNIGYAFLCKGKILEICLYNFEISFKRSIIYEFYVFFLYYEFLGEMNNGMDSMQDC